MLLLSPSPSTAPPELPPGDAPPEPLPLHSSSRVSPSKAPPELPPLLLLSHSSPTAPPEFSPAALPCPPPTIHSSHSSHPSLSARCSSPAVRTDRLTVFIPHPGVFLSRALAIAGCFLAAWVATLARLHLSSCPSGSAVPASGFSLTFPFPPPPPPSAARTFVNPDPHTLSPCVGLTSLDLPLVVTLGHSMVPGLSCHLPSPSTPSSLHPLTPFLPSSLSTTQAIGSDSGGPSPGGQCRTVVGRDRLMLRPS